MGEIFRSLPREPNSGLGVLIPQPSSATVVDADNSCHFLTIVTQAPGGNPSTASPLNVIWLFVKWWQGLVEEGGITASMDNFSPEK